MAIDAHKRITLKFLLPLLLLLAPSGNAFSQAIISHMINGDTLHLSNCRSSRGSILFEQSHTDSFDGWAVVDFYDLVGYVTATWGLSTDADNYMDIWDGDTNGTKLVDHSTGLLNNMYDSIMSGRMTIHIHCSPFTVTGGSLNLTWYSLGLSSVCENTLYGIQVGNIGATTATVVWHTNSDSIMVDYGSGRHMVSGNGALLLGLDSMTTYTLHVNTWNDRFSPCCEYTTQFTTLNVEPTCSFVDTALHSPFCLCTYGPADSLFNYPGIISGRHTVLTDTTARDPVITSLRTIPPGHSSSVRLGNRSTGAQGESITYLMKVDTNVYNILMLKYAAVLQNPDHNPSRQPRFTFALYDENMELIDPDCGAATFVANSNMGWNNSGGIMWKDWTTIGTDLTPYHGRYINVQLTTRDCLEGAHFGYAYFVIDFYRKGITSPQCGANATTSLLAPEGFNYYWYTDLSPDTISTEPTVDVTEGDTYYHCHMSYIENPDCGFTLSVYSGQRYPLADFEPIIVTTDCIHFNVLFNNLSTVSNDGIHPVGSGEPCDSSWWSFGNGETSSVYSPTTSYDTNGTYNIVLISSISHGQCQDTLRTTITLPTHVNYEEYYRVCDSMTWWRTGDTYYYDTSGVVDVHPAPNGCDTAYELCLRVYHSVVNDQGFDTSCWSVPYHWRGHTFSDTNTTLRYERIVDSLHTLAGCDSLMTINVLRYPKVPITFSASADCIIKQYRLTGLTTAPYFHWTSSPLDPALDGHTTDSVLVLIPEETTNYKLIADFSPTGLCPTRDSITLEPVSFPTAYMRVSPEYMTLDNLEFDAYDIDNSEHWRSWTIRSFTDGSVVDEGTAPPVDHIHRYIMPDIDSVAIGLAVSNGFCHDTNWQSIPLIRTTVWAPNIFTPELFDTDNNRFQIIVRSLLSAELNIYNRDGLLIFHTDDINQPWDGTYHGRPCMQGAYVWHLNYVSADFPDKPQVAIGTVTLIR